jgi:hypothetical protein
VKSTVSPHSTSTVTPNEKDKKAACAEGRDASESRLCFVTYVVELFLADFLALFLAVSAFGNKVTPIHSISHR